jgi:hypothetical protein
MAGRKEQQRVSSELFSILYSSFMHKLAKDSPEGYCQKAFEIGAKIGGRLVDDFFLAKAPKRGMSMEEVVGNAAESFFPHYFSYRPASTSNTIIVSDFPLLHSACPGSLSFFCGILTGVYGFLAALDIKFVSSGDGSRIEITETAAAGEPVVACSGESQAADGNPLMSKSCLD